MKPKHLSIVTKAVDAALAAIEIYNKPSFNYREEVFALLMITAWELLLKARILRKNKNKLRSVEIWETLPRTPGKKGPPSKRPKQTRSGNNITVGMNRAMGIVRSYPKNGIDDSCIKNLVMLIEIRDNAIHFYNKGPALQKQLHEIGSATLRNFAHAASLWFGIDFGKYKFYILPLAFERAEGIIKTVFTDKEKGAAKRLMNLFSDAQTAFPFDPSKPFNVGVKIEMRFVRTASPEAIRVQIGPSQPGAIPLLVTEEDALARHPWRYDVLLSALKKRYSDFKQNDKFINLKKSFERNQEYCKERFLDPKNPRSSRQRFYNPNILSEFDRHYTLR